MSEDRRVTADGATATGRRVRILLADDDDTVRFLLRELLEAAGPYDVAAVASDGREAVDTALEVRPEVAVLDLAMPRMSGLEAAPVCVGRDARRQAQWGQPRAHAA